jgi:xanthosine utilization system XapX-like protein
MSITLPTSLLVFLVYILGMLTGGSLVAFLKTIIKGAKEKKST